MKLLSKHRFRSPGTFLLAILLVTAAGRPLIGRQVETLRLTGETVDQDYAPIATAGIVVDPVGWAGQTDSLGRFAIPDLPVGAYRLAFTADGFAPRVFQFTIPADASGDIDLGPIVLGRGNTRPITLAGRAVSLVDSSAVSFATVALGDLVVATTDGEGRFRTTVEVAEFTATLITVRKVGFVPSQSRVWLSSADTTLEMTFQVEPFPVTLEEIVISAEKTVFAAPHMRGFYMREREGGGSFITAEDIDKQQPYETTDLLRRIPGILIQERVLGELGVFPGKEIKTLRGGGRCEGVLVYIDGARISEAFVDDIDRMIDPRTLGGVEVYTGAAQIPVIFNPTGSACGVIVFWLK